MLFHGRTIIACCNFAGNAAKISFFISKEGLFSEDINGHERSEYEFVVFDQRRFNTI